MKKKTRGTAPDGSVVYATTERLLALCGKDARDESRVTTNDVVRVIALAMSSESGKTLRADPRAFTTFASRLNRAKKHACALRVFEAQKILGVERNAVSYNAAMVAHVRRNEPREALKLFEEMLEVGHEPSVISYNVAMGACARAGDGERALALFDEIAKRGLVPDAVSVNTAIAAAEMIGDDARIAHLRSGAHFSLNRGDENGPAATSADEDEPAVARDDDGDDDDDSDDEDEDEDDREMRSREDAPVAEIEDVGEDEEARRAAARKRKREIKERLLAEYNKNAASSGSALAADDEDEEMAKRRRKDARRAKFEEKRRLRKEARREKRPWTVAAAHAKKAEKSAKATKRSAMKADPRVWVEDIPSDDEVLYDEDGERVLKPISGPSFLDDPNAAKLMNSRDGDDFWSVGF